MLIRCPSTLSIKATLTLVMQICVKSSRYPFNTKYRRSCCNSSHSDGQTEGERRFVILIIKTIARNSGTDPFEIGHGRRFVIAWQSQVGPKRWMGPKTPAVIKALASRGNRHALVVPIGNHMLFHSIDLWSIACSP